MSALAAGHRRSRSKAQSRGTDLPAPAFLSSGAGIAQPTRRSLLAGAGTLVGLGALLATLPTMAGSLPGSALEPFEDGTFFDDGAGFW
jgi:hypothetical protein